ncbi:MAG: hypothetical protein IPO17_02630 [Flavobacteriales bacterium]|nr:hypothetical protein [Flavobacteriales bacterium]
MNALRKLIPQALQRYDLYLQQSMPRLWATRIHYHLWFLLLLNALLFCFGMLLRVDRRNLPDPEEFFGWMIVPAIIYFAFWIYKVVLFTVERRNGLRHPFAEVGEFLVHMVSIALIFSLPFTIGLTLAWRIDRIVGDEQFVAEVDALNKEAFLFIDGNGRVYDGWEQEYDYTEGYSSSSHQYFRDLAEYKDRRNSDPEKPKALDQIYSEYVTAFNEAAFGSSETLDPHKANYYKPKIDSIQNNFPFYFVEHGPFTPGDQYYNFDLWSNDLYVEPPFLSDSLLEVHYVASLGTPNEIDRDRIANALAIADTYYRDTSGCTVDSVIAQFKDRVRSTSRIHRANRQLEDIWEAKTLNYGFANFWVMFYVVVISSFCLALLIGIFKNIYWQPFLISIVVCILLPIIILCLSFLFTYNSEYGTGPNPGDIMLYTHYWIGVALIVQAPFIFRLKAYRTSRAVMTIIANCIVPFIALVTLMILHEEFDIFGEDVLRNYIERLRDINHMDIRLPALEVELDMLQDKIATITQIVLWGGMALYLFVLHGFFRTLLARLVSMPERK